MSDLELFARAVLTGWHHNYGKSELSNSICYGCGYSDTVFFTARFTKFGDGDVCFDNESRQLLLDFMLGKYKSRDLTTAANLKKAKPCFASLEKKTKGLVFNDD